MIKQRLFLQIFKGIYFFAKTLFLRKPGWGNHVKKVGIAFIIHDKSNSAENFWKMGYGKDNLFSKKVSSPQSYFATAL